MITSRKSLLILIVALLLSSCAYVPESDIMPNNESTIPAEFIPQGKELRYGKSKSVSDGDTFWLIDKENKKTKIRLNGIDAPESAQPYGDKSKEELSSLINNRSLVVVVEGVDGYNRILGYIISSEYKDINLEMIKRGMAWHYSRYNNNPEYAAAQENARNNKIGLWQDPNPIEPETWRRTHNN